MISLQNISFQYGTRKVLNDISFEIHDGDFIALLGANGVGKSTLLKIMSGLLKPTQGDVVFAGKSIKSFSPRTLAKQRAVLEQESALDFDYSALDSVLLGRYAYNLFPQNSAQDIEIARQSLKSVGLDGFENRTYTKLSGGEKQRVQLARALCQLGDDRRGKLLLLDEPSASLDPAHTHAAMRAAKNVSLDGGKVVAVLHDPNLAANYATKIALIKDGKLLKFASPQIALTSELLSQTYNADCKITAAEDGTRIVYFPIKF